MSKLDLYQGPDRGEFMVQRLITSDGPLLNVNCRIRKATVFNFASQYVYAIVGYQIEYWRNHDPAPYNGGQGSLFKPKDRANHTTFYMRTKVANTLDMLYLEDGIINDFINVKLMTPVLQLESYAQAASDQINSIAVPRLLSGSGMEYRNGIHITNYENDSNAPLKLVKQGLKYMANHVGMPPDETEYSVLDYPFKSLKDMVDKISVDFSQRFEVQDGSNS